MKVWSPKVEPGMRMSTSWCFLLITSTRPSCRMYSVLHRAPASTMILPSLTVVYLSRLATFCSSTLGRRAARGTACSFSSRYESCCACTAAYVARFIPHRTMSVWATTVNSGGIDSSTVNSSMMVAGPNLMGPLASFSVDKIPFRLSLKRHSPLSTTKNSSAVVSPSVTMVSPALTSILYMMSISRSLSMVMCVFLKMVVFCTARAMNSFSFSVLGSTSMLTSSRCWTFMRPWLRRRRLCCFRMFAATDPAILFALAAATAASPLPLSALFDLEAVWSPLDGSAWDDDLVRNDPKGGPSVDFSLLRLRAPSSTLALSWLPRSSSLNRSASVRMVTSV
mmetsp:Transcript_27894/g.61015  ORF Transcript_27894/g.61015 Transcript_27894/m.61015 type:complete len:337 (-) Transcript_27894:1851-2861(-)